MRGVWWLVLALSVGNAAVAQDIGREDVIIHAVQDQIANCMREPDRTGPAAALACFDRPGVTADAQNLSRKIMDNTAFSFPGMLVGFSEAGQVDVAEIYFPNMANTNFQMALVNTAGGVQMAAELNFTRNPPSIPSTRAILSRYPQAFETGRVSVVAMRKLPDGNQRFVLSDIVTDGCRACEPVATSLRYFDFSDGRFSGARDLGWQLWQDVSMSQAAELVRRGDVATIQNRLNLMGYDAGPVDGAAGPRTMSAVMAFKRDHCLPENNQIPPEFVFYLAPSSPDFSIPPCAPGASAPSSEALPFPDGIYSADARLCPPASLDVRTAFGDRAYRLIVSVEKGSWSWGESNCTIAGVADDPRGFTLDLNCLTEGFSEQTEIFLAGANSEGFTYDGREFWQCQAPVTELPIPAGTYAHDDRLCPGSAEHPPNDVAFEAGPRPLNIDGTDLSWADASCEIMAARQSGPDWGLDLTCVEGNNYKFQTTRQITILSDTTVMFEGFEREWCGAPAQSATQEVGGNGELPVNLEQGVYAFEPAGCPEFDGEARTQREQVAANLRVILRDGTFTQGEQSCPIARFTQTGDQTHLEMDCLYDGTPVLYRFEMEPQSRDSFQRYDNTYKLCSVPDSQPKYTSDDVRAWSFYDLAGGDRLRDVYRSLIFEKQNSKWMLRIAGFMNGIGKDTSPNQILAYIDTILHQVVGSREDLSLGVGVPRMSSSEQGRLYTLWLLNAARSKYQAVSHDYHALETGGFKKLSPQKSAYHAIGLDARSVEKWVHSDGREYVYRRGADGQISLVFDGQNNGTYNYCGLPACHLMLDILPWVKWGATLNDPSTPQERAILFRKSLLASNYSWEDLLGFF